jgi:hypothetical protein
VPPRPACRRPTATLSLSLFLPCTLTAAIEPRLALVLPISHVPPRRLVAYSRRPLLFTWQRRRPRPTVEGRCCPHLGADHCARAPPLLLLPPPRGRAHKAPFSSSFCPAPLSHLQNKCRPPPHATFPPCSPLVSCPSTSPPPPHLLDPAYLPRLLEPVAPLRFPLRCCHRSPSQ